MIDYIIKGGRILDPGSGRDMVGDVAVSGDCIGEAKPGTVAPPVIDAQGCLVLPGLIDFHTHLYFGGSGFGVSPDLLFSSGVTTAVDAGSTGCANFEAFYRGIIANTQMPVKVFLNVSPPGQLGYGLQEPLEPAAWNLQATANLAHKYRDVICGLKIRVGQSMLGELGMKPLKAAKELAASLKLPLCVHVTDSSLDVQEIADVLQKGDIFCHVYQGKGAAILQSSGQVHPAVIAAAERGVLFDAANGKSNFSFQVAERALTQKFYPHIISTDITPATLFRGSNAKSLPFLMSKYLALGMPLEQVVKAVTAAPAKALGMPDKGTLAVGAKADIVVMKLKEGSYTFSDVDGTCVTGSHMLVPQMVVASGKVMFTQTDFNVSAL